MNDSTDSQTDSDDTWFCDECGDSVWLDGSDASKTKVWVDSIGWLCGECKEDISGSHYRHCIMRIVSTSSRKLFLGAVRMCNRERQS